MDAIGISEDEGVDPQRYLAQEPSLGAHLTTTRRGYCHHGIYLSGVSHSAQVQQPLHLPFRVLNALFHT